MINASGPHFSWLNEVKVKKLKYAKAYYNPIHSPMLQFNTLVT